MNRIPRTRFVTLMAAAAGVTAGFGAMAGSATQALARTPTVTELAADTLPSAKPAAVAAKAKEAREAKAAVKKPAAEETKEQSKSAKKSAESTAKASVSAKDVVKTSASNGVSENDSCENEADCRNGDGTGY
jgi:hypothetical protein